jgi:hypothetical protein
LMNLLEIAGTCYAAMFASIRFFLFFNSGLQQKHCCRSAPYGFR